jgi:hypothetical protein
MSRQAIFWSLAYAHQDSNNMRCGLGIFAALLAAMSWPGFWQGFGKKRQC